MNQYDTIVLEKASSKGFLLPIGISLWYNFLGMWIIIKQDATGGREKRLYIGACHFESCVSVWIFYFFSLYWGPVASHKMISDIVRLSKCLTRIFIGDRQMTNEFGTYYIWSYTKIKVLRYSWHWQGVVGAKYVGVIRSLSFLSYVSMITLWAEVKTVGIRRPPSHRLRSFIWVRHSAQWRGCRGEDCGKCGRRTAPLGSRECGFWSGTK